MGWAAAGGAHERRAKAKTPAKKGFAGCGAQRTSDTRPFLAFIKAFRAVTNRSPSSALSESMSRRPCGLAGELTAAETVSKSSVSAFFFLAPPCNQRRPNARTPRRYHNVALPHQTRPTVHGQQSG